MPLPGVVLTRSEVAATRSAPTDTGVLFLTGLAAEGPTTPQFVTSTAEAVGLFGDRDPASLLYDSLDVYFREGGARACVSRVTEDGEADTGTPTEADWTAALARFEVDLGPGQVAAPGRTTPAAHAALLAHAESHNRVPLLDAPDVPAAAAATAIAPARLLDGARDSGAFWPWAVVPGVLPGTTRTVPYSAVEAGIIARNDAAGLGPNQPAAGEFGQSRYAIGLSRSATEAERLLLHNGGVNVARVQYGGVRTYGYRTLVDEVGDPNHLSLGAARTLMAIQALAEAVAERFVFRQIDGGGRVLSEFEGALSAVLVPFYAQGALYGATPAEAFRVDTGASVNTPARLAAGELRASLAVRVSPFAEAVVLELVKVATQEALA